MKKELDIRKLLGIYSSTYDLKDVLPRAGWVCIWANEHLFAQATSILTAIVLECRPDSFPVQCLLHLQNYTEEYLRAFCRTDREVGIDLCFCADYLDNIQEYLNKGIDPCIFLRDRIHRLDDIYKS